MSSVSSVVARNLPVVPEAKDYISGTWNLNLELFLEPFGRFDELQWVHHRSPDHGSKVKVGPG